MGADFCLILWLFSLCICKAVTYNSLDDEQLSNNDIDTKIDSGDWMDKAANDDNYALAARKRLYETLRNPSMDMQTLGDVRALVQALDTHMDKLDARTLFPDKRAYGEVKTVAEMLRANADKLDNLTGEVNYLIDSEKIDKTENLSSKIIGKLESMNADLTTRLDNMNPYFISMFVMLADISFATSLRLAKHEDDMKHLFYYFRNNIETDTDRETLGKKLSPVFQWYTGTAGSALYTSCLDYRNNGYTKSGVYMIYIPNTTTELNVYCDQVTDGGGWLVFQRRQDGSVDFYQNWAPYKEGFGDITGEFWLGNDNLNLLTANNRELRIDILDFDGNTAYAKYSAFAIGSESEKYKLSLSGYSGTAGDSLVVHNGMAFSTKDRDNDIWGSSCAQKYKGGWWWYKCHRSNLNGIYYNSARSVLSGVTWYSWKKWSVMKKTEMKIRPKQ